MTKNTLFLRIVHRCDTNPSASVMPPQTPMTTDFHLAPRHSISGPERVQVRVRIPRHKARDGQEGPRDASAEAGSDRGGPLGRRERPQEEGDRFADPDQLQHGGQAVRVRDVREGHSQELQAGDHDPGAPGQGGEADRGERGPEVGAEQRAGESHEQVDRKPRFGIRTGLPTERTGEKES